MWKQKDRDQGHHQLHSDFMVYFVVGDPVLKQIVQRTEDEVDGLGWCCVLHTSFLAVHPFPGVSSATDSRDVVF